MTPTKAVQDNTLRKYALDNLRSTVRRLKDADAEVMTGGVGWRTAALDSAAKWAAIVKALEPEPGPVEHELRFADGDRGPE